jgi:hypothetical protein
MRLDGNRSRSGHYGTEENSGGCYTKKKLRDIYDFIYGNRKYKKILVGKSLEKWPRKSINNLDNTLLSRNWGSSVIVVSGYRLDERDSIHGRGKVIFF